LLLSVSQHSDDQQIKHLFAALDQVEMAVRHRIKGAGIDGDGCFHGRRMEFLILTQAGKLVRRKLWPTGRSSLWAADFLFARRNDYASIFRAAA
jgi:hypothetical protein